MRETSKSIITKQIPTSNQRIRSRIKSGGWLKEILVSIFGIGLIPLGLKGGRYNWVDGWMDERMDWCEIETGEGRECWWKVSEQALDSQHLWPSLTSAFRYRQSSYIHILSRDWSKEVRAFLAGGGCFRWMRFASLLSTRPPKCFTIRPGWILSFFVVSSPSWTGSYHSQIRSSSVLK